MNFFTQYKGLRKENYILFLGRIVTNMGAMIGSVLTLILNQKMGMDATGVAMVTIISGIVFLPTNLIGGKIADKYNKKNCIIGCDIISISLYIVCAFIPLSYTTIVLIMIAAACQNMERPVYNALIADITYTKNREKAFSLQYLGGNIGLIASPIIAGLLFKNYLWLSFLLSGVAIAISTVLIFFKIKDISPVQEKDDDTTYQESRDQESMISVLLHNKVIFLYIIIIGLYEAAYMQYGYLMPLDLGRVHGENGAVIFGSVTSLNCIVVVFFTPIFTKCFSKVAQTNKSLLSEVMLLVGYGVFLIFLGKIPVYYLAITLFTFGEILNTIASGPYTMARIPASHRGRVQGFMATFEGVAQGISIYVLGRLFDLYGSTASWIFVFGILGVAILGNIILIIADKRRYTELYRK